MTEDRAGRVALIVLLALTAVRLAMGNLMGLGDDEAEYWCWSRHLALSYCDHPPLNSWMIAATTALGGDSPFFVRLGSILLFALTSWLVYLLACDLSSSRRVGLRALCLLQVTPVFAVGGQQAFPDVPLGFFWTLFLLLLWRATTNDRRVLAWPAGLALGCALLSKYFAVLLPVIALLWLARRENRHWLRRPEVYGALLLASACAAPIVAWNASHDWASLHLHASRHAGGGFGLRQAGMFFGGQALYYSPLLWGGFLWALVIAIRQATMPTEEVEAPTPDRRRACAFLATASLPPLLLFTAVGLWTSQSKPHWTAMGYLPLCIAAALLLPDCWQGTITRRRRALRTLSWVGVGLPAVLIVLLHVHVLTPLFMPLVPQRDRAKDLTSETFGWLEVGRRAEEIAATMDRPVLLHYHHTKSGQLAYAVKERLPVLCLNDRLDQFDFWQDEASLVGRDALYVTDSVYARRPEEVWRFDRYEEEAPLEMRRGGFLVRRFSFWRCYGYRGPTPGRAGL